MADSAYFPRGTRGLSRTILIGILFVSWQMALAASESKGPSEQKIVAYVDPTYGAKIRHLQKDDGQEHNLYYYRNPWNADSSHMVGIQSDLQQENWRVVLYDGDGLFLRELFPISQFDWRLAWDRNNPHLLYTWHGSRLYRFHVDTSQADLLKDFAPLGLKPNGPSLDETGDRLLVATSDGVLRSYHLPALDEERTFTPSAPAGCFLHWDKPHYVGHKNYIDTAYSSTTPGQEAIVVYDDTGKVVHTFDGIGGGGHYTFSPDGRLAYFRLPVAPRRGPEKPLEIHVVNLDGTADRVLVSIPWAKAAHVQNLHLAWPSKVKDWFVASFFPSAGNVPAAYAAPLDEILLIRTDGTCKYLARTGTVYSRAGARGAQGDMFWAQPLSSPSNNGRRICFNSNRAGTIDQYILYTEP